MIKSLTHMIKTIAFFTILFSYSSLYAEQTTDASFEQEENYVSFNEAEGTSIGVDDGQDAEPPIENGHVVVVNDGFLTYNPLSGARLKEFRVLGDGYVVSSHFTDHTKFFVRTGAQDRLVPNRSFQQVYDSVVSEIQRVDAASVTFIGYSYGATTSVLLAKMLRTLDDEDFDLDIDIFTFDPIDISTCTPFTLMHSYWTNPNNWQPGNPGHPGQVVAGCTTFPAWINAEMIAIRPNFYQNVYQRTTRHLHSGPTTVGQNTRLGCRQEPTIARDLHSPAHRQDFQQLRGILFPNNAQRFDPDDILTALDLFRIRAIATKLQSSCHFKIGLPSVVWRYVGPALAPEL